MTSLPADVRARQGWGGGETLHVGLSVKVQLEPGRIVGQNPLQTGMQRCIGLLHVLQGDRLAHQQLRRVSEGW